MNIVINKVRIARPLDVVFDLVTTARHWPEWHPSTISVSGTIERPYQLGDTIRQRAHVAGRIRDGVWTVTEHRHPERVVLQMYGGELEIRYSFEQLQGSTRVIRRLTYPVAFVENRHDLTAVEEMMHAESEQGLQQLKTLIEGKLLGM